MRNLLKHHRLKLLYSRDNLILRATSRPLEEWNKNEWGKTESWDELGLFKWIITGDWHKMTIDTNDDKTTGLDGNLALNTIGSWYGGTLERDIELRNYGEILFEHYVQNGVNGDKGSNILIFYIDGVKKLAVTGSSPWQRCIPIGLTPGKHRIKFEYLLEGEPNHKKGVLDTVTVWEAADISCLITEYAPPKPSKNLASNKVLRGFTRYQEMSVADTEINFTAAFNGLHFLDFMQKSDSTFYFVDEFGVCYRGIFPDTVNPECIAMNEVYIVELTMIAGQKTGLGFC